MTRVAACSSAIRTLLALACAMPLIGLAGESAPASPDRTSVVMQVWDGRVALAQIQVRPESPDVAATTADERGVATLADLAPGRHGVLLVDSTGRSARVELDVPPLVGRVLGLVRADFATGATRANLLLPGLVGRASDIVVDQLDTLGRRELLQQFENRIYPETEALDAVYRAAREEEPLPEEIVPPVEAPRVLRRRGVESVERVRQRDADLSGVVDLRPSAVTHAGEEILPSETAEQQAGREILETLGLVREDHWPAPAAELAPEIPGLLFEPARRALADGIELTRVLGIDGAQYRLALLELERQGLITHAQLVEELTAMGLADRETRELAPEGAWQPPAAGLRAGATPLGEAFDPTVPVTRGATGTGGFGHGQLGGGAPGANPPAATPDLAETEPNNTLATCTNVGALSPVEITLTGGNTAGDVDYYCFPLDCGDVMILREVVAAASEQVEVYGTAGELLFADDTLGGTTAVGTATRWRAETTGTYAIAFRRQSNIGTLASYTLGISKTAGSCPGGQPSFNETFEPNNTPAACATVPLNFTTFDGLITALGDVDHFCVNAPFPNFVLEMQASSLAAFGADGLVTDPASVQLEVLDPSNAVVFTGGVGVVTLQSTTLASAGVHVVRVKGAIGTAPGTPPFNNILDELTGPYRLALRLTGVLPDAAEPDNTRATCVPITPGVPTVGRTLHQADNDWYCLPPIPCNATVAVTFTPLSPLLEGHVQLWSGVAPGRPDNSQNPGASFEASDPFTAGGQAFTLTATGVPAGDWRIRVNAGSSATTFLEQSGDYQLSVTITPGPADPRCDGDEPNDGSGCTPLPTDGTWIVDRWIWPEFDSDYFCVDVACGQTLIVEVQSVVPIDYNGDDDFELELFHASAPSTSLVTNTGNNAGPIIYTATSAAEAGPHQVRIWGDSLFSSIDPYMPIGDGITASFDIRATVLGEPCPVPEASEPNDTQATCGALVPNSGPSLASISPVTDIDFHCVTAACGDVITVTVTPLGGLQPLVNIRDAVTPTFVWATGTSTGPGAPLTVQLANVIAGQYAISVDGVVQTGGSYTIDVTLTPGVCVTDPLEAASPAGTFATCHFIGLIPGIPVTIERAILDRADRDVECFLVDCGTAVKATVTPTDPLSELEAVVTWINHFGTPVVESAWRLPNMGDVVDVEWAALRPAIHAVEVRDRLGRNIGTYELTLEAVPNQVNCVDANDDTPATCLPITPGVPLRASALNDVGLDIDHYCFHAECGDTVTVSLNTTGLIAPSDAETEIARMPEGLFIDFGFDDGDVCVPGALTSSHCGSYSRFVAERSSDYLIYVDLPTNANFARDGAYELLVEIEPPVRPEIPVTTTLEPAATRFDAAALAEDPDYVMSVGANPLIDISGFGTSHLQDDDSAQFAMLPFPFEFYGFPRTSVRISSEGYLTFSEEGGDRLNDCPIPNTGLPGAAMFAFWDDLDVDVAGAYDARVYTATLGTAPSRQFVVQWHLMPMFAFPATGSEHTFQAILHEGTNVIEYRYGALGGDVDSDGGSATIGVENDDGSAAVMYSCADGNPVRGPDFVAIAEGMSLEFAPAPVAFPADDRECYSMQVDTAPFLEISATGTLINIANGGNSVAILPIAVPFFGNLETVAWISGNGFLAFNAPPTGTETNDAMPDPTTPNDGIIAPYWDDMGPATVYTQLFGTPGSGTAFFVVEWKNVPRGTSTGSHTFEAILHESGVIEFRYDALGTSINNDLGGMQSVGLEARGGGRGIQYSFNDPGDFEGVLAPGRRITFSPPATPRFTWRDPATNAVLATGATYQHPLDGSCELELFVQMNDPLRCCPFTDVIPVDVPDRVAPVIVCPAEITTGSDPGACGAVVAFAATVADNCDAAPAVTYAPLGPGDLFPVGRTTVTVSAVDAAGNAAADCAFDVVVVDDEAPAVVAVTGLPECLWPPNHEMLLVDLGPDGIDVQFTDNCPGGAVSLVSCESDEDANGQGDGNTDVDCEIVSDTTLGVRRERAGGGDGRQYVIGYEVHDAAGNVTSATFAIHVPHDQSDDCPTTL